MTASFEGRFRAARRDPGLAVLEGLHPLKHALRFGAEVVEAVAVDPDAVGRLARELAPDLADRIVELLRPVGDDVFAGLAPHPPDPPVLAIARRPANSVDVLLAAPAAAPVVFLDRPAHLGNIGAVVRVAAAAGAAGVLTTGSHDPWHPTALRGAAGLHYALPVTAVEALPDSDRPLVAFDPEGAPLGREPLPRRAVLAFGTERGGLGPTLLARADRTVRIPMRPGVSSLNLATSVAVALYAVDRAW